MDKARATALKIINAVHEQEAYANVALAKELRKGALTEMDRRFVTELVYGTVKAGETLDWIIRRYINRPLSKVDSMVLDILRMGVFQLRYMDKVPPSAACNESVELAKSFGHPGLAKFVNGVMRTMVREPEKGAFPTGKGNATIQLALEAQHPEWLVRRWIKEFGYDEALRLCSFNNSQAPLAVRTNTLKTNRSELMLQLVAAGLDCESSLLAGEGVLLRSHGALDSLQVLQDGYCQVQDESSMLVAHVVDPQPGDLVLDVCSAPGGKTTHMAALMGNRGRIVACDIYEHKLARVRENADRLGINIIDPMLMDAREIWQEFPQKADRVLVDAPCSGLGVLRRKPDSRWRKTPALLEELPKLQMDILRSAAACVKPGGMLVYSTCTITHEENQDVVRNFLAKAKDFELENAGERLPVPRDDNMVQLYPQRDGTDGFFIACMRRKVHND
ncbi:MAG: 16S rRNA (cytosine(967)-C(5))-methyltransferase RsmB [Anaerovibrio sp.]|uniref:16S rRNA (cytosine(967)-C(5))-methyltransferase RsmB n=1 Tax=Anaerovibrio sp. TaxID=1872532 RepID=UPI0025F566D6|nr:16S rRNA (cytosine(967)-C(5))-methyltransferase RsmB [Anaerovibrio sp.]MCR5177315.1 16S rRNA (cytosine(967)-C(5))-methyltransferase RsmB [Anaerovibrio sp.]